MRALFTVLITCSFAAGAVPAQAGAARRAPDPRDDARYLDRAELVHYNAVTQVVEVKVAGRWYLLDMRAFSLARDPVAEAKASRWIDATHVYTSAASAQAAAEEFFAHATRAGNRPASDYAFVAFYRHPTGVIVPTSICKSTAPRLIEALARSVAEVDGNFHDFLLPMLEQARFALGIRIAVEVVGAGAVAVYKGVKARVGKPGSPPVGKPGSTAAEALPAEPARPAAEPSPEPRRPASETHATEPRRPASEAHATEPRPAGAKEPAQKPALAERERALQGTAKKAKWPTPEQGKDGPGLRDHAAKHADEVGANTPREYDLSARETIQRGRRFRYRDPATNEPRVGYWDEATGLFTATSEARKTTAILTHFKIGWDKLRKLPGFAVER